MKPSTPRLVDLAAVGAALAILGSAASAGAYPADRRLFQVRYGKATRCELCHAFGGGSERNAYGKDWQRLGEDLDAFAKLEALDSDGDGASNLLEIQQGSNPGDPASTPAAPGKRWQRPQQVPIPSDQLALVFPPVDSMEALEAQLEAAQLAGLEQMLGEKTQPEDAFPTLYFAVKGGKRVAVASFSHFKVGGRPFTLLVAMNTAGRVQNVTLFRAGDHSQGEYRPFLDCFAGRGRDDLPTAGRDGCPATPNRPADLRAISGAVQKALWTVQVLFARK